MFVRSADGKFYPIASVEHLSTDDEADKARLISGQVVELAQGEIQRVVEADARTFPAGPDIYVLEQIDERCRTSSYARVPVLAWVVSPIRGLLPVTTEGINHGLDRTLPVLMPSGEIVVAGDCTYADEDCFLNELKSSRAS
jgi:hypothetical protein